MEINFFDFVSARDVGKVIVEDIQTQDPIIKPDYSNLPIESIYKSYDTGDQRNFFGEKIFRGYTNPKPGFLALLTNTKIHKYNLRAARYHVECYDGRMIDETYYSGIDFFNQRATPLDLGDELRLTVGDSGQRIKAFRNYQPTAYLECAVLLDHLWMDTHYHVLVQTTGRIFFVHMAKLTKIPIIYSGKSRLQLEVIRELLPDSQLVNIAYNSLAVKHLFLPTFRESDGISSRHFNWVRSRFRISSKVKLPRRLYVSRMNANSRRVINEAEVLRSLEYLQLTVVCFERLGFRQQVELVANAELIIGPSGSGLTNVIFSNETHLIEFTNQDFPNIFFWWSAKWLGHRYAQIGCKSEGGVLVSDLQVDVQDLREALEVFGFA